MILLGNLLWFILGGGVFAWLGWLLTGVLLAITVVGLPFSFAAFRIASFAAFPFGKQLVDASVVGEEAVVGSGIANVLWIVFAGIWLTLGHIAAGVSLCVSIVGIPFGLAHFKLAAVSFAPLGKRVLTTG